MKILFAIALPIEMKIIKSQIKSLILKGIEVDFLVTGVGVFNTIYNIKNYISQKGKPDFLVNIGVCGKKDNLFQDFFQVYRIKSLSTLKEALCPIYIQHLPLQSIACSDTIVTDRSKLSEESLVDMESFGIDFIAEKEKIPFIIIKKPFDLIGETSKKVSLEALEYCLQGFDFEKLLDDISEFLGKNTFESFEKEILIIKENHRLTFSQTELLKKFINKEIAYGQEKEEIFTHLTKCSKEQILLYTQS